MQPNFSTFFNFFLKLYIAIIIVIAILFIAVSKEWLGELPSIEFIKNPQNQVSSVIYTEDFEEMGKLYYENRTELNYKQISQNTFNALIATEDARFYDHAGVDIYGMFSAAFRTLILGKRSGASTITQQLAKNLFHNTGRQNFLKRLVQKFKEWYIAVEIERNFSKKEILALYFNTVPFLHNSFGIREASRTYFSKEPIQLTIDESAILVGMLKGPSTYNPKTRPEKAKERRNIVLGLMEKHNFLNSQDVVIYKKLPIHLNYNLTSPSTGLAPYLREQIRIELDELLSNQAKTDGTKYNIYSDGLKIFTTINSKLQAYAEESVNEHMPWLQKQFLKEWRGRDPYKFGSRSNPDLILNKIKQLESYINLIEKGKTDKEIMEIFSKKQSMRIYTNYGERDTILSIIDSLKHMTKILQVGLCAIDPHNGKIKAWVGGIDFHYFKLDHVRPSTKRQVGSTIKPLLYSIALENGETPCTEYEYLPPSIPGFESWNPKGTKYFTEGQKVKLKDGLQVSDNRIAALLIKKFGPSALIEKAESLGIEANFESVPSIALGTTDISVYEMIGAYSAFMNSGITSKPYYIERIEDKNGNIIFQNQPQSKEVISEQTAKMTNLMMQQVSKERGTATRLRSQYGFKGEIACKTGTTQSNSDGWFIGSTPGLLTAIWVGADEPSITFASTGLGQGASSALPIWAKFYKKAINKNVTDIYPTKSFFNTADSSLSSIINCIEEPPSIDAETIPLGEEE